MLLGCKLSCMMNRRHETRHEKLCTKGGVDNVVVNILMLDDHPY